MSTTYEVGQAVIIKHTVGFDDGPWRIIEIEPNYEAFKGLDTQLGYRMVLLPHESVQAVFHESVIDHIFQPEPGRIIEVPSPVELITAQKLRKAFEDVLAARELLVEAVNRFKALLDKTEDSKGA